ncbi:MAG: hypothetical protein LN417_03590, partial [Candidatus Thermoplasmatota archaeon]|nr:hypothetical protein [Candidatus Thermoplasmatota archaeon]
MISPPSNPGFALRSICVVLRVGQGQTFFALLIGSSAIDDYGPLDALSLECVAQMRGFRAFQGDCSDSSLIFVKCISNGETLLLAIWKQNIHRGLAMGSGMNLNPMGRSQEPVSGAVLFFGE